ncbi:hypothetical protein [Agromyces salentinus]|uniref:Uncharacterized protein n=1 Tax=Agromyces salentinus TaxID=269421 RepID=A0ABN2MSF1_9MICO|nr:hypothetical protein [Agromyces salentinus]
MSEEHPELAGYEPAGGDRRPRRQRVIRVFVVLALAGMVLPIVLSTFSVAATTARNTCSAFASAAIRGEVTTDAPLELFAAGGPGWQCYMVTENGDRRHLANFGFFPSAPRYGVGTPT